MAGGEGEAYQCGSLEVLEASVYVKWPILFSAFNMMSDWISWFNFTEGVKGFHCWFLMIVFHGLAGITLLSFYNRYDKPKCNIVHYLL